MTDYKKVNLSVIGSDDIEDVKNTNGSNEVVMRLAVAHEKKEALNIFSREEALASVIPCLSLRRLRLSLQKIIWAM